MYESKFRKPSVTATVVILQYINRHRHRQLYVLLGKRSESSDAFPGMFCLPGGFLNVGEETTETCARRELLEETGIDLPESRFSLVTVTSGPNTDPRDHVVNVCYKVLVTSEEVANAKANDDISELKWEMAFAAPRLAFDHNYILNKAIGKPAPIYIRYKKVDGAHFFATKESDDPTAYFLRGVCAAHNDLLTARFELDAQVMTLLKAEGKNFHDYTLVIHEE